MTADRDRVFAAIAEIVGNIAGMDPAQLEPAYRIQDLDLDSMLAGEIIAQMERALDVDVDFRAIADDWSTLTLGDLVTQFQQGAGRGSRTAR